MCNWEGAATCDVRETYAAEGALLQGDVRLVQLRGPCKIVMLGRRAAEGTLLQGHVREMYSAERALQQSDVRKMCVAERALPQA